MTLMADAGIEVVGTNHSHIVPYGKLGVGLVSMGSVCGSPYVAQVGV